MDRNTIISLALLLLLVVQTLDTVPVSLPETTAMQPVMALNQSKSNHTQLIDCHSSSLPVTTEENEDDCPPSCTCCIDPKTITIGNCAMDPAHRLPALFEKYSNLEYLQINHSRLSSLPVELCNMSLLNHLIVTYTKVTELPWQCISKLRNLTYIDASGNQMRNLGNFALDLPLLKTLKLAFNLIEDININVLSQIGLIPSILVIDLSNNRLTSIDSWPAMFSRGKKNVPYIDLSNNQISITTNIAGWKLDFLKKPTTSINLQQNNITHILPLFNGWGLRDDMHRFALIYPNATIDIRNNDFSCDCVDYDVYRILRWVSKSSTGYELFCARPAALFGQVIMKIALDKFVCNVHIGCPEGCKCTNIPNTLQMSVQCPETNHILPYKLPKLPKRNYFYYLDFYRTNLSSIDNRPYLQRVKTANFTRSKISNITIGALNALSNVAMISLDLNDLTYLPNGIMEANISSEVKNIQLASNNWHCDCHSHETQAWMLKYKDIISDKDGILCTEPTHLSGSNLLKLPKDKLICGEPPNEVLISALIAGGATLSACIVLIVLPLTLLSIKRVWVFKVIKWHPFDRDECEGENKEFDVFVAYSNENEVYVEEELIPGLEQRGYKVAFHKVHFPGGTPIHISIEQCIRQSKRTLVVFSHDFLDSNWCMWEFTVAFELDGNQGTHRLLALKYPDVDIKTLDLTLQAYFKRYSYIEQDSPRLWDKIEYSLPLLKLGKVGEAAADAEHILQEAINPHLPNESGSDDEHANNDTVGLLP